MSRVAAISILAGLAVGASAQSGLFLYDVSGGDNFQDAIWRVDEATPDVFDPLTTAINNAIAGFEYAGGNFWAASTNTNTDLFHLDGGDGSLINTVTMAFPSGGDVITSMEMVGGTLYGGFTTEGGGASHLVTIDTTSGNVSMVGAMGIDSPTGGLAYNGTMYTVNSGAGGAATLYSVALGSGAATAIGAVAEADGTAVTLTGLEFGTDGVLYGLGRGADEDNGCLEIAPGSHDRGLIGSEWEPLSDAQLADAEFLPIESQPGDAVFFDSYAPHRSAPNRSDGPRRVLYVTYGKASDGDQLERYYADKFASYPPDIEREAGREYRYRV